MRKHRIEIRWALVIFIFSMVWVGLEREWGLHDEKIALHAMYTNYFSLIAMVLLVLAMIEKRNRYYGGHLLWRQGLLCGVIISILVTLLNPAAEYVSYRYISPHYLEHASQYAVQTGQMSQWEAKNYFQLSHIMLNSMIGTLLTGLIASALVALIAQRKAKRKLKQTN